jgi:hypothetical protein
VHCIKSLSLAVHAQHAHNRTIKSLGWSMATTLTAEEIDAYLAEIERLREEHRDLDTAIDALSKVGPVDQLQLQRLKKRKLVLRDRLTFLEDQLTPDIIA